jgi:hypothetical protein
MDFDIGFDGEEDSMFDFNRAHSKSAKKRGSALNKNKRTFGTTFQSQNSACSKSTRSNMSASSIASNPSSSQSTKTLPAGASSIHTNSSFCSSSPSSSQSGDVKSRVPKISIEKSSRRSRQRIRRRPEEEEEYNSNDDDDDDDDESLSARSSCDASSAASTATGNSIATVRSRAVVTMKNHPLSVRRGAGSSAYAVQNAGTYQMIHDECSYLCSTILSTRSQPSKAIGAAIDLATLLSSRKTRSMLWKGGSHSTTRDDDRNVGDDNHRKGSSNNSSGCHGPQFPSLSSEKPKKLSPIPKVWSSILEVLALAATTGGSFDNCPSSNSSISSNTSIVGSVWAPAGRASTKSRTKSARRKDKELLKIGGCAIGAATQTTSTANTTYHSATSKGVKLSPDLKDVLACIFYFLSWDCTMSGDHSIAAMGAVKSSTVARKIRLAILERGAVLTGILRLMAPSQPLSTVAATTTDSSQHAPFPSNIFPTTTKISEPPVSPLRTPTSSITKRSLRSASMKTSSSTVPDAQQHTANGIPSSTRKVKPSLSSKVVGDPTAMGRRKRKNRRKLKEEEESPVEDVFPHTPLQTINTDSISQHVEGWKESDDSSKIMPPPSNRSVALCRRKFHGSDELSFADVSVRNQPARNSNDDGGSIISEASMGGTSILTSRIAKKVVSLRAKVHIESASMSASFDTSEMPFGRGADSQESIHFQGNSLTNNNIVIEGVDRPWLSIVCLESLTRILTGKELDGKTSCLEEEDASRSKGDEANDDDDDIDDDNNDNVVIVTNRLVGKSGMIPLLSCAMSHSMAVMTKLVFSGSCIKDESANWNAKNADEEYWMYCFNRLKLLASIIDEACFFSERNRRSFCEDDPFSFQDRKKGLVFHILIFLQQCSRCNLNELDHKRSETMSLALRTLTSLTHDNSLAAEQMKGFSDCVVDFNNACDTNNNIQGIRVLAKLVFRLEESPLLNLTNSKRAGSTRLTRASDHDMHQYDGTIFCLTTLANVTEGAGIGRMLMEIKLELHSGKTLSWLEWLCQWLVKQTETFRQEILSIGKTKKLKMGSIRTAAATTTTADSENGELHEEEEEKLVAAGNGSVVLACLITESDDGDPESSISVRNLIKKQMPLNSDGSSSGLSLVVNTLKAYCNYYHMSMGEMSVAVVSPVRKLINDLEEIAKFDEDQLSHSDDK